MFSYLPSVFSQTHKNFSVVCFSFCAYSFLQKLVVCFCCLLR